MIRNLTKMVLMMTQKRREMAPHGAKVLQLPICRNLAACLIEEGRLERAVSQAELLASCTGDPALTLPFPSRPFTSRFLHSLR